MFFIVEEHSNWNEVIDESDDSCKAYELAHQWSESKSDPKDPHIIMIRDEDGNDMWDYCAGMRCPSKGGLFQ